MRFSLFLYESIAYSTLRIFCAFVFLGLDRQVESDNSFKASTYATAGWKNFLKVARKFLNSYFICYEAIIVLMENSDGILYQAYNYTRKKFLYLLPKNNYM